MDERIVITGMGAVTPIGIGVEKYWSALVSGECGVGRITRFETDELPVKIAAEVKDFDAENYMTRKVVSRTDPFTQFALAAAAEALEGIRIDDPDRTGITLGTAVGGISTVTQAQDRLSRSRLHRDVSPHFMPSILGNVAAAHIAIAHGLRGPSLTVSTACSSGGDAIGIASDKLKAGEADMMVSVGAESILCPLVIDSLRAARALSTNNEAPGEASRPFDRDRDGFVIGEGAGVIVLETLSHAQARGARIFGELVGCANLGSAFHVTAPEPDGRGAALCMERALKSASLTAADVDYVNAHGTSTKKGDLSETIAMKSVFGDNTHIPMSSTKGHTGHLMGAGGITEIIACIKAIETGVVPPTINLNNRDPQCDLDYVPREARKVQVNVAMSNSFGFGGQNSSVIVRSFRAGNDR